MKSLHTYECNMNLIETDKQIEQYLEPNILFGTESKFTDAKAEPKHLNVTMGAWSYTFTCVDWTIAC